MNTESRPLEGITICYVSAEAFSGLTRTMKQAKTMREAGARVVFAGLDELMPAGVAKEGFEVVCAPFGTVPWSQNPLRLVRGTYNRTIKRLRDALRPSRARRALTRAVVSVGADIVQAVDLGGLECAALAAQATGAKLTYDSHEMWHAFLDNPELNLSPAQKRRLLRVEERFAPRADIVFVVSDEMGRRMARRYPLTSVLTVFNSPVGSVARTSPAHSPVRLCFHGSLAVTKNVTDLVHAMVHLQDKATLDIHGAGLTVAEDSLKDLVRELGLTEVVRIHGAFRYEDVLPMLADYDVDAYAARAIEENFAISLPNKVFDAICAGLAVAAPDFPAIRELVEVSGCGVCLDTSSPASLVAGLRALVDDPAAISAMKERSLAFSQQCRWETQGATIIARLAALVRA